MTTKEWAEKLNGRQYMNRVAEEEERQAKEDGVVIVYCEEGEGCDDVFMFNGAIHDDGRIADEEGLEIMSSEEMLAADRDYDYMADILEDNMDDEIKEYDLDEDEIQNLKCPVIRLESALDNIPLVIETNIPHETFDMMDGGNLYCRGIVFRLADAIGMASK